MTRRLGRSLALIGVLLVSSACAPLTIQEEKELGHKAQRQVRDQFQLMRDRVIVNYVRDIGETLVHAAPQSPFSFRFYVVEDEAINAFAVPGGAIYIHTGLIMEAQYAAEVAGVLAHEMGHVTCRHVAHIYRRGRNTGYAATVLTYLIYILTGSANIANAGQLGVGVAAQAYMNTFTQEAEREADAHAVETMVRAGYDPNALISMFETLLKQSEGGLKPPQFLMSHPATQERIKTVRALIRTHEPIRISRNENPRKLEIIQERIQLVIGTDPEAEDEKPE